jgi:hypothetical protein
MDVRGGAYRRVRSDQPVTQGRATARKTRGRLPWADMLRPLRGKSE